MPHNLVDSTSLTTFLQRLGQCYRHTGRVYLVGGPSLIMVATKISTFDIDLQFEVEKHGDFIRCLRELGRNLNLAIEQASLEQFLPLPAGYQERHQFIGRFGSLDVFHFDFYSVALSKLHRGNEKDFSDVTQMLHNNLITLPQLEDYFAEILPQLESYNLQANPDAFYRKFTHFKTQLVADSPD